MIAENLRRWIVPLGALALIAAAPAPVRTQMPGYYRYAPGSFEVTALYDGYLRMPIALLHGIDEKAVTPLLSRHLPFPGIGHLRRDGDAYAPVEYAPLP